MPSTSTRSPAKTRSVERDRAADRIARFSNSPGALLEPDLDPQVPSDLWVGPTDPVDDGWSGPSVEAQNPGDILIETERDDAILGSLRTARIAGPILDLGCGDGSMLDRLAEAGYGPLGLLGTELALDRCIAVRRGQTLARVVQQDDLTIPFKSSSLGAVVAMNVFSSFPDDRTTAAVSAEIDRVLRPGGSLHIYDIGVAGPGRSGLRPVSEQGMARHFEGYRTTSRSLTLLPLLTRRLGSAGPWLYEPLSRVERLKSHRLLRLTKPKSGRFERRH